MRNIFVKSFYKERHAKIAIATFASISIFLLPPSITNAQTRTDTSSTSTLVFTSISTSTSPSALLYVTGARKAIESLRAHVTSQDIVAPQTYIVNSSGKLSGRPKQEILNIAQSVNAQIMPLVSNQNFSQSGVNTFLNDPAAQDKLLASLVLEAVDKKYIGYQYDFEHIPSYDRDLYTQFIQKSAPFLHNAGLKLSVAIAPIHSDNPSDFALGSWQNWTGAFDYSAIGAVVDFVSVMAYDDGNSVGPTASLPWATQVANYTLAHIPANKVSFGLPFYAWVRSTKTGNRVKIVGYPALAKIIDSGKYIEKGWSDELGVPFLKYRTTNGRNLTAWYEDAQSFQKKIELIKNNKMMGYSAWALGLEDPKVWDTVIAMRELNNQVAVR